MPKTPAHWARVRTVNLADDFPTLLKIGQNNNAHRCEGGCHE